MIRRLACSPRREGLKAIGRLAGYILLIASVGYFVRAFGESAVNLPAISWNITTVSLFGALHLATLVTCATGGLAWHLWLKSIGEPSRPILAITLVAMAQIAKYIPGSVAQHITRLGVGKTHGLGTAAMVITFGFEIAWTLTACLAIALGAFLISADTFVVDLAQTSPFLIGATAILALALPSAAIWLITRRRLFGATWLGTTGISHPDYRTVITCLVLYGANFAIFGAVIDLLAQHVFGVTSGDAVIASGVFALAWGMGFIAIVSPGGIGVRDAVLVAGLTPIYGAGAALGIAVAMRILTSIADVVCSVIGCIAERNIRRPKPAA